MIACCPTSIRARWCLRHVASVGIAGYRATFASAGRRSATTYDALGLGDVVERVTRGRIARDHLCHEDPMFTGGECLFGQCGSAQSHLRNNGVGLGDVFLFFGLFADELGRASPSNIRLSPSGRDAFTVDLRSRPTEATASAYARRVEREQHNLSGQSLGVGPDGAQLRPGGTTGLFGAPLPAPRYSRFGHRLHLSFAKAHQVTRPRRGGRITAWPTNPTISFSNCFVAFAGA